MSSNTKKILIRLISLLVTILITVYVGYAFIKDDFQDKIKILFKADVRWIILGIGLSLTWIFLEVNILQHNAVIYKQDYSYKDAFINTCAGVFFSSITPFNSGGQFFQIFYMRKQGFKTSESIVILMLNFIIFTFSLVFVGLIFFLLSIWFFPIENRTFSFLFLLGILSNSISFVVLFLSISNTKFHKFILRVYSKILKIRKTHSQEKMEKFEETIDTFNKAFIYLKNNIGYFVLQLITNTIRLIVFASLPIAMAGAFHVNFGSTIFEIIKTSLFLISAQIFVQLITSFIPLPGGSGGAELIFTALLTPIFGSLAIPDAMILWRLLSYYLHVIFAGAIALFYYAKYERINNEL